jgi:beta-lactamase regulating signal transducer with metallopeptidase domain
MNTALPPDAITLLVYTLNVLLSLTSICIIALVAIYGLFRHNPFFRYAVCLTGILCLLVTPLLVALPGLTNYRILTLSLPPLFPVSDGIPSAVGNVPDNVAPDVSPAEPLSLPVSPVGILRLLLCVWFLGVLVGSIHLLRGLRRVRRLTHDAYPCRLTGRDEIVNEVAQHLTGTVPPVYVSPGIVSPIAVGIVRPVVILPERLVTLLTPDQLRQILLHECAHIRYRHTLGGILERFTRILFWPHPLVLALCRELARAREEVCDNVASQDKGAACYARTLLAIAQGSFTAPPPPSALALLGPETSLEDRIKGLLDPRRNRMIPLQRWKTGAVTGLMVLATVATIGIRIVAAQEQTDSQTEKQQTKAIALANNATVSTNMAAAKLSADDAHKAKLRAEAEYKAKVEAERNAAITRTTAAKLAAKARITAVADARMEKLIRLSVANGNTADVVKLKSELYRQDAIKVKTAKLIKLQGANAMEVKAALDRQQALARKQQALAEKQHALATKQRILMEKPQAMERELKRKAAEDAKRAKSHAATTPPVGYIITAKPVITTDKSKKPIKAVFYVESHGPSGKSIAKPVTVWLPGAAALSKPTTIQVNLKSVTGTTYKIVPDGKSVTIITPARITGTTITRDLPGTLAVSPGAAPTPTAAPASTPSP